MSVCTHSLRASVPPRQGTLFRHPQCGRVATLVGTAFAVPAAELQARTRGRAAAAFARQSAMYLAHVALGLSLSEVARAFGRDRTTAAHACRIVEERRDDPQIDALMDRLECACRALVHDGAEGRS